MKKTIIKTIAASCALISLAACGGGSTGGGTGGASSFAQLASQSDVLLNKYPNLSATPAAQVPTSGAAVYRGVMAAESTVQGVTTTLAGEAKLRVGFGANTFTGSVTNIRDSRNRAYGGQLNVSKGELDRSGPDVFLTSDLKGTLMNPSRQRIDVDGGALLGVAAANHMVISGVVGGDFDVGNTPGSFFGAIIAER